ncbi:MAG TPA: transcriptional regulator [Gammaproteobacteria bacterium]|nr:transcriptional regulator [Gammaproteobacteria bacterium]
MQALLEDPGTRLERNLKLLQGKYSARVLHQLFQGTRRFGELKRAIPGISAKTLSDRLRFYTQEGIVTRISYNVLPLRVEYHLTPKGEQLRSIMSQLQHLLDSAPDSADEAANGENTPTRPTLRLNGSLSSRVAG